jgi:TonB-dependent starch-binding outer membrane protein SusC
MKQVKLLFYTICTLCIMCCALPPLFAQELAFTGKFANKDVQEDANAKPLKAVLEELENKYNVSFFYKSELVESKLVKKNHENFSSFDEEVTHILKPNGLTYERIQDKTYVITSRKKRNNDIAPLEKKINHFENTKDEDKLLLTSTLDISRLQAQSFQPLQQAITVTGTVTDESGAGLPGVNVVVKGTASGTTTNADGKYSLSAPDGNSILVFSYIGYTTEEVAINGRSVIDISLVQDIQSLSEVVVVGYGTQIKKDVTGAISSVKAQDIKNIPVASPDALLQGKAAGVQVVQNSGTPGGEVFVRVRGTASLLGETRPLFVIDGVPMNNSTATSAGGQRSSVLADINPNDIESMEILKDAAATAIYGARGSNGVVLITTKRGKSGKARINFDAYTGVQQVWKTFDLLNGEQFVDLLRESLTNRDPNLLNRAPYNQVTVTGINTDYQSEIFRPAPISNYTLSLTGGDEKLTSYISLGYFTQQGTIIGQEYNRLTGRLNLDYQAAPKLKIGTSTTFSNAQQARVENDFSGYSVLANALLRNPNLPVRNDDGTYSFDPLQTENPVQLANEITFNSTQRRIVSNVYAQYDILKNLTFRSVIGVDYLDDRVERYVPSFIVGRTGRAEAIAINLDEQTIINDNTLTYNTTINDQHRITLLGGFGIQKSRFARLQAGGQTAGSDIITTIAIADPYIPSHYISDWALVSYFGRANYSFQDKYLVEASFRVDGSSRFGVNKRYGVFPGLSLGWRVSQESFMENIPLISDMKLRAGIGVTGNQDGIGNYAARALYGTNRNYDGNPGIGQQNIPNPDLGWESTTTTNVGMDLSLFNARVNVTADAYLKRTNDLIFARQLPWTSGFGGIGNANIGAMENRGLEFALSTRNLTGDFQWTTDFNIAFNRTKITDLPINGALGSDYIFKLPDAYGVEGPYSIYRIGQPVGSFFGYVYQGVYARDEDVPRIEDTPEAPVTDLYERGVRGGDPIFLDVNNDGVLNRQFDRVIIGNALPKHIGGITNTFSYKGIELSVVMNWSYGNDIYNMTRAALTGMIDDYNQSTEVLQRWQQQGDITNVPRAIYGSSSVSGAAPTDASSRYLEDGSFLRVRNVTLGYSLPTDLVGKIKLASARVYISGQNLLTFTNYSGLDPENQNLGFGVPTLGVDYLTQPQPRILMGGINIGF